MDNFDKKIVEKVVERLIESAEKDILLYNDKATDFKYDYKVEGIFIFFIGYSKVNMKYGSAGIYRMVCTSIYDSALFKDGNVIDYDKMYSVDDVISKTKGYFYHYSKILNNL
jgi:hypothetical protein